MGVMANLHCKPFRMSKVCFQEGLTMEGRVTLNMGGTDGLGPGLNRRKQALLPERMP